MKSRLQRSRDIDRAYEELAERLHKAPGITCLGEHGSGLAYTVRRLGMAALDVVMTVDLLDGNLWWRMTVASQRSGLPTWHEVSWCKRTFAGAGAAYIPLPEGDGAVEVLVPLEQDPLEGVAP